MTMRVMVVVNGDDKDAKIEATRADDKIEVMMMMIEYRRPAEWQLLLQVSSSITLIFFFSLLNSLAILRFTSKVDLEHG